MSLWQQILRGAGWAVGISVAILVVGLSPLGTVFAWHTSGSSDWLLQFISLGVLLLVAIINGARGRYGYFLGMTLVLLAGFGALSAASKSQSGVVVKRFLITVEDQSGNKLGFGVWELVTNWKHNSYSSDWRGEAFSIEDSAGKEFFVGIGMTRNVDRLFFKSGFDYPKRDGRSHIEYDRMLWEHIRRLDRRVEAPHSDSTPIVVGFANVDEPWTTFIAPKKRFTFFIQPTDMPLSDGIGSRLRWLQVAADGSADFNRHNWPRGTSPAVGAHIFKFGPTAKKK